jgi:hypothetical protein
MSKIMPSAPDEDLGGFSVPPDGDYVAALLEPEEKGMDEADQNKSEAELKGVPVKAILLFAQISRGEYVNSRTSLYCGLTKEKGQMNFLRFIAGTGLAPTIEAKYPDLGPIEQGWDDRVITSRKFFNELRTIFPGHEVNIHAERSKDGNFANIKRVWPIGDQGSPAPVPSSDSEDSGW